MILGNAVGGVVRARGVLEDASVPNMRGAQLADGLEGARSEVGELAAAVFFDVSVILQRRLGVAEEARKDLINDGFLGGVHCYKTYF